MKNISKALKKAILKLLTYLFWITVWFIISKLIDLELILPSPIKVFKRLLELLGTKDFYITASYSFLRIIIGFILGMLAGMLLAFLSYIFKIAESLTEPIISIIKATPVASFIVMVFLFFDKGSIPMFIAFLMVIPISYENILLGLRSIDGKTLEFAKMYDFSKKDRIIRIYFPCIKNHISSAAKTSLGLAWKAGIAAEVIANPSRSIGQKILESKVYLESIDLYAWTVAVIIISVLLSSAFKRIFGSKAQKHS